jgi:hypothetical protein
MAVPQSMKYATPFGSNFNASKFRKSLSVTLQAETIPIRDIEPALLFTGQPLVLTAQNFDLPVLHSHILLVVDFGPHGADHAR